jgi:hypothetical protein
MDSSVAVALAIVMRWLHIASVIILLGGFVFARFVVMPALKPVDEKTRGQLLDYIRVRFRPLLFGSMALVVLSGIYNLVGKLDASRAYHIWFGIKMIFALHIFGVGLLLSTPGMPEAKRSRLTAGVVVSGAVVVAVAAYLRWLSLH